MYTQTQLAESGKGEVLIPLIRAAATIGFAIAPCSLGFVIIAVSEHLIRSIMVGDDPEMLMSDLQNQFPNNVFEIIESDDAVDGLRAGHVADREDQGFQRQLFGHEEYFVDGLAGPVAIAQFFQREQQDAAAHRLASAQELLSFLVGTDAQDGEWAGVFFRHGVLRTMTNRDASAGTG